MKICICKKDCMVGVHNFKVGAIYSYRYYIVDFSPTQKFHMYEIYMENDFTNFEKFDFNQYFNDQKELRKQKLKKLNYESR